MYKVIYWLLNQSKIFSAPQNYVTDDKNDFIHELQVVKECCFCTEIELYASIMMISIISEDEFDKYCVHVSESNEDINND